jgi:hypothetical protein
VLLPALAQWVRTHRRVEFTIGFAMSTNSLRVHHWLRNEYELTASSQLVSQWVRTHWEFIVGFAMSTNSLGVHLWFRNEYELTGSSETESNSLGCCSTSAFLLLNQIFFVTFLSVVALVSVHLYVDLNLPWVLTDQFRNSGKTTWGIIAHFCLTIVWFNSPFSLLKSSANDNNITLLFYFAFIVL